MTVHRFCVVMVDCVQVLGEDNCGCPCREERVVRCDTEWVEHCYTEHYQTKCEKRQAYKPRLAREVECQKCRKFPVTVMKKKLFKECAPLYDEKCSTTYDKHCKTNRKCTMIYQTQCSQQHGYTQTCTQVKIAFFNLPKTK